jgi:hypothetical protein
LTPRLPKALLGAACALPLSLSAAGCEILGGIEPLPVDGSTSGGASSASSTTTSTITSSTTLTTSGGAGAGGGATAGGGSSSTGAAGGGGGSGGAPPDGCPSLASGDVPAATVLADTGTVTKATENAYGPAAWNGKVYWAGQGTKSLVETDAATGKSNLVGNAASLPLSMVADADGAYWTAAYSSQLTAYFAGKTKVIGPFVNVATSFAGVAADETTVYWAVPSFDASACDTMPAGCCASGNQSCLLAWKKGAAGPTVLVGGRHDIVDVAVQGGDLYFVDKGLSGLPNPGTLERCSLAGGTCAPAVYRKGFGDDRPLRVLVDDTHVYWAILGKLLRAPKDAAPGDAAETVATLGVLIRDVKQDHDAIYLVGNTETIYAVPKASPGQLVTVAKANTFALATDCHHLFWAEGDKLMSVSKGP